MDIVTYLNYYTKLHPTAQWSVGEDYDSLEWYSTDISKPSLEDLEALTPQINIEIFKTDINRKVNDLLTTTAQSHGYSSIESIISYAVSTNAQWKAEADTFVAWRDQVWEHVYVEYMVIDAGGEIPDEDVFMATLPKIIWPGE